MFRGLKQSEALIGVGLSVGLILVIYGANRLMSGAPQARLEAAVPEVQTVVAARAIPRGRPVEASDLALTPAVGPLGAGALTNLDAAVGRIALVDIAPKQAVTDTVLANTGAGGDLANLVPIGFRAISIQTNDEIAVSNLLRPGDLVDVQVVIGDAVLAKGASGLGPDRSEAGTLLQAVRVVAVGAVVDRAPKRGGDPPEPSRSMTLAMTPAQITQFTLARSLGSFYLALRNPRDGVAAAPTAVRLGDVRTAAGAADASAPPTRRQRPRAAAPPARTDGVELVVGGQTQTIYPQ